ncbi:MAG TPA: cation transporter [Acidimicrobiales bacterium]|nr:cation transporter [Acidimicrobiales bacterium]
MSTVTTTYTVKGMTCGHCVNAVSTEVGKLADVTSVEVDLDSGAVKVTSTSLLDLSQVTAAVDEAGYELAGVAPEPGGRSER